MLPISYSAAYISLGYALLRTSRNPLCLISCRFRSNNIQKDEPTKLASGSYAQSLPSTNNKSKYEPKTLLEEMKLAELSRKTSDSPNHTVPPWIKRQLTQKSKYDRWNPKRKLSRQEMIKVKELKETFPQYRTVDLAQFFHISPEAIRRILKSKWVPNDLDEEMMSQRKERKIFQRQERDQTIIRSKIRGGTELQKDRKRYKTSGKTSKDDDELNKNYNRIHSQF
ncbi:RRG9 [Candida margitis]|uniref:RRG9 n=1 Tax=Candida margitis TaxID=1775924 RepID=UPI0022277C9C|nr:RRG9 [Candida margitis]KAI5970599.1 RRG9 [Candida margitis]